MALELDGKGLERLGRLQTALSPSGFQALGDIIDYADDIFNITADSRQYTDSVDKDTTVSVKQILQAKIELFLLELLEQCPEAQDAAPVSRSQLVARTNEELRRHRASSQHPGHLSAAQPVQKLPEQPVQAEDGEKHHRPFQRDENRGGAPAHRFRPVQFHGNRRTAGLFLHPLFFPHVQSVAGMTPSEYEKSLKKGGAYYMDTPYYLQAGETFFAELYPRRCILRVTHRDVVYAFSSERPPFLEAEVDGAVQTIPFDMARSVLIREYAEETGGCLRARYADFYCGGTKLPSFSVRRNSLPPAGGRGLAGMRTGITGTRRAPCAASASPSRWISTARTGRRTPSCL